MKFKLYLCILLSLLFITNFSSAQDIVGSWNGILKVQTQELVIVFNISENTGVLSSTMDSPSQGAMGLATDNTTFIDNILTIDMSKFGINYVGTYNGTSIIGTFTQGGTPISLDLTPGKYEVVSKLQEPKEPYPYLSEEVVINNENAENIKLSGTLTIPANAENPPVAILITGSGPQNRNQELLGHKPFLVLSDHLTRKGIAVLRYDDRGTAQSEGRYEKATTFDFASDVESAVAYLKTRNDVVDIDKIGLIGHSEGGLIAPIVASKNKEIAFCVLLAAPGISGKQILMTQTRKAMELGGVSPEDIEINEQFSSQIYEICADYQGEESKEEIIAIFTEMKNSSSEMLKTQLTEEVIQQQVRLITSPWMRTFIQIEPKEYLSKVNCPVLAINGEKDFQVVPEVNLEGIKNALKSNNNTDVTINEVKDLNHLFQTSETGSFTEYASNEETLSPIVLEIISDWINERFPNKN
jgi:pimeloyl-ACP methyl ester carboxylesterase